MFFAFQRGTLELGILFHCLLAVLLDKPHNPSEAQAHPGTVAKIRHGHVGEAPTWHSTWLSPLCLRHSHHKPKSLPFPKQRPLKFCCGLQSFTSSLCPSPLIGTLPLWLREGLTQTNIHFHS